MRDALSKQLSDAKVDSKAVCVGLWKSKDKQTLRKVFRGPKGGIYTQTAAGTKIAPEEWEPMEEAEVDDKMAAHEAWKAASPSK